jgi:hypothetical protein
MMRILFLIFIIIYFTGCSVKPKKVLTETAIATGVGIVAGVLLTPKGESQAAHGALWGASSGLAYSGVALYRMSQHRKEKESKEIRKLSLELSNYKNQFDPKLVKSGLGLKESPLPKELKSFIRPGEWKHYKLDRWVKDDSQDNVWVRQTELFEFIPPTIN